MVTMYYESSLVNVMVNYMSNALPIVVITTYLLLLLSFWHVIFCLFNSEIWKHNREKITLRKKEYLKKGLRNIFNISTTIHTRFPHK